MTGTVKTVRNAGFGFIRTDERTEVFFHRTALVGGLEFNEQLVERRVRFQVISTERGPRAVAIQPE